MTQAYDVIIVTLVTVLWFLFYCLNAKGALVQITANIVCTKSPQV